MQDNMVNREVRALAAAVLTQAVRDYRRAEKDAQNGIVRKEYNLKELDRFFNSSLCEMYCEIVGIDREFIIAKLKGGDYAINHHSYANSGRPLKKFKRRKRRRNGGEN